MRFIKNETVAYLAMGETSLPDEELFKFLKTS